MEKNKGSLQNFISMRGHAFSNRPQPPEPSGSRKGHGRARAWKGLKISGVIAVLRNGSSEFQLSPSGTSGRPRKISGRIFPTPENYNRFEGAVENLDFERSGRKAWGLLRRLGGAGMNSACKNPPITTSNVASHIVNTSKAPKDQENIIQVEKEFEAL
ncbi:hypothetical protein JTB14_012261 [Gonioctena quinquepunctata]|nr:hypothetical protein JTB14_012261 [Gonioctena quinquepunctata]